CARRVPSLLRYRPIDRDKTQAVEALLATQRNLRAQSKESGVPIMRQSPESQSNEHLALLPQKTETAAPADAGVRRLLDAKRKARGEE
ncbi:MAG: hypothetical protein L6Q71_03745, partial [Planctomycetes bacterium]|nr:hypothetical protein [Planctomycetota bacterium]